MTAAARRSRRALRDAGRLVLRNLRSTIMARFGDLFGMIVSVDVEAPLVALTFDDGPDPVTTPRVLDLLQRHGVLATFFVIGRVAERHPALIAKMVADGHAVGQHTYDHVSLPGLATSDRRYQVERGALAVGSHGTPLLRCPFGHYDLPTWWTTRRCGHEVVGWSDHAHDWEERDARVLATSLRASLRPGTIVLLHDAPQPCDTPGAPARNGLLMALDEVLAETTTTWRFVTVPELLRAGIVRRRMAGARSTSPTAPMDIA